MAEGYISSVVCACGCDTYLSQPCVERGWRYIRGHKPKDAVAAVKTRIIDRPVTLASRSVSYADVFALADAERPVLEQQIAVHEADIQRLATALRELRRRLGDLETVCVFAGYLSGKVVRSDAPSEATDQAVSEVQG